MLPFTAEQFFGVFRTYNEAIWPIQIAAFILGGVAVALAWRAGAIWSSRVIAHLLALMWAWTGIAYFWFHFVAITPVALAFGGLFLVQSALFLHTGATRTCLRFGHKPGAATALGTVLIVYSAILYPLLGVWAGHSYPQLPLFGVTPCPVTIFTFGMLLLTITRVPRMLLVIPFVWSLIGGTAAFLLGVPQDWVLLIGGPAATATILLRDHGKRQIDSMEPAR